LPDTKKIKWPEGKKFAFTIFDDTDFGTVENLSPVYSLLNEKNIKTTKSVWVIKGDQMPLVGGLTCEDSDYLAWIRKIKDQGFEIASHSVTYHTSKREDTIRGYNKFFELFGQNPDSYSTHYGCNEGVYNGMYRVSGLNRVIYNLLTRNHYRNLYDGHIEHKDIFWGDVCKERIKYVRSFVFGNINTLAVCPYLPYYDPSKPYVNYWFASTEGADVNSFNKTISEKNQDKLEMEGGACIMYTHLASGFYKDGKINEKFGYLLDRLSKKDGWFVPVNKLLDYLLKFKGHKELSFNERKKLEVKWLFHKILTGAT
jgi:hypothetical protein